MAGPWEKYQRQDDGPWSRYAATAPAAPAFSREEEPFANAPMDASERLSRLAASYVPGSERIRAAGYATFPFLIDEQFRNAPWPERYDRALRITRHRDDAAQQQGTGVTDLAARTAGLGATTVGTGGMNLLRPVLNQAATLPQIARESARISGGIGAPVSLANTRGTTPAEQAADVATGTLGSMALGFAAPYGFAAGSWLAGLPRRMFSGP